MEYKLVSMDRSHLAGVAELERLCFSTPWNEAMLEEEKRLSYVWEDEQELEQLRQYNGCGTVTYYPNDPQNRFTVYYKIIL